MNPAEPAGERPDQATGFVYSPVRIGPRFVWLDHEHIRILDGGLTDRQFRVETRLLDDSASISLFEHNVEVANELVERDPPGRGVVLWDAGVREPLRGNGLCSIMTWIIFRELLESQATASFRIRMVRSLKADSGAVALQNIGMGVVTLRLGFQPDPPVLPVLSGGHIRGVRIIPPGEGRPPALQIDLDIDPLVLVAYVLNPDTLRPLQDFRYYTHLEQDHAMILDSARSNLLVVGGNYSLRKPDVDRFVNRLALDEDEAVRFRHMIRGF